MQRKSVGLGGGRITKKKDTTTNCPHRSTGSGTSHISQIGVLGSGAHGTSDARQILYLGLYTNYK